MGLFDGLDGDARRDRDELVVWLQDRGFSIDETAASVASMRLPANRSRSRHSEDGPHGGAVLRTMRRRSP